VCLESMRRNFLNSSVLFVFLFTQFISMYCGLQMIASPSDFDSIDDISLEDIVPLDPFLSGTTFNISETLPLSQSTPLLSLSLHNWHATLDHVLPLRPAFFECNQTVALMHDKGLWLANRVILS